MDRWERERVVGFRRGNHVSKGGEAGSSMIQSNADEKAWWGWRVRNGE